jgi:hypothetical protein
MSNQSLTQSGLLHIGCLLISCTLVACAGGHNATDGQGNELWSLDSGFKLRDAGTAFDSGADGGNSDSGSYLDAGTQEPGLGFLITVPGADELIPARAPSHSSSAIEVLSYPTKLSLPVRHGALPVGYEDAFSNDFCANVRSTAALASADTKEQIKQMLRRQGTVTARFTISSVVGPEFIAASVLAARAAEVSNAASIANPLVLSEARISLELGSDATSRLLGDTDALENGIVNAFVRQESTAYEIGTFSASIAAKDLWCDLAQGKATLHVWLSGEVSSKAYTGEVLMTGVRPL